MTTNNALWNCRNPWQGKTKKVLCVCSAGLLRSPTTAVVLSQEPYNYNTRAAGIDTDWALIPVSDVLLYWADEIVCMNDEQKSRIEAWLGTLHQGGITPNPPIKVLGISDDHGYRSEKLIELIKERYVQD